MKIGDEFYLAPNSHTWGLLSGKVTVVKVGVVKVFVKDDIGEIWGLYHDEINPMTEEEYNNLKKLDSYVDEVNDLLSNCNMDTVGSIKGAISALEELEGELIMRLSLTRRLYSRLQEL